MAPRWLRTVAAHLRLRPVHGIDPWASGRGLALERLAAVAMASDPSAAPRRSRAPRRRRASRLPSRRHRQPFRRRPSRPVAADCPMSSVSHRTPSVSAIGRAFSAACSTRRLHVCRGLCFCAARSTSTFSTARNAMATCGSSLRLRTDARRTASASASAFPPTSRRPRAPVIRPTSTTSTTRPPSQRRRRRPPRPPSALRAGHSGRRFQCQRDSDKGRSVHSEAPLLLESRPGYDFLLAEHAEARNDAPGDRNRAWGG